MLAVGGERRQTKTAENPFIFSGFEDVNER
jgi:hypothetical protein